MSNQDVAQVVPADSAGSLEPLAGDSEAQSIVKNELTLLDRTREALNAAQKRVLRSYDQELIELRDEIAAARLEDVASLVEQMSRLQSIAAKRAEVPIGTVDANSPYFGHLKLREGDRTRDVLIGNSTYVDTERGVRIVDWRDAPVSRLYYRYSEGDEYEEEFGGRTTEGTVLARRSVVITGSVLRRVMTPQGTFVRRGRGDEAGWHRMDVGATKLAGGQGTAERPPALEEYSVRRGRLGVRVDGREDRHLPDIPALIDKRQFELISKPSSGLVVIQGGAGSGKTTIGLHRIAYLAFREPKRFSIDRMLVVVFNDALCSYISRVLPGLGVEGVQVITYQDWASRQRGRHLPRVPSEYREDTPTYITQMKKHPVMLKLIDERVQRDVARVTTQLTNAVAHTSNGSRVLQVWEKLSRWPLSTRLSALGQWSRGEREVENDRGNDLSRDSRLAVEAELVRQRPLIRDVLWDWAELITDRAALGHAFTVLAPGVLEPAELEAAIRYNAELVGRVAIDRPKDEDDPDNAKPRGKGARAAGAGVRAGGRRDEDGDDGDEQSERDERDEDVRPTQKLVARRRHVDDDSDDDHDDDVDPYLAVDGVDESGLVAAAIDREDDALLLRLFQRKRGPLRKDKKTALLYEHVFVDEAQDLSPVEMAVLMDCVTPAHSVTFAGDVAQRLYMDNGFSNWKDVLGELGLNGIAVEPLRIGYRSTAEVLDFAREVLGPLADPEAPVATRHGAPVEMHRFAEVGSAVAFLGTSLRELLLAEPRASVAVIARDPERAALYYKGLAHAEVPRLSHVKQQDFSFKPGVEVTDIRQVKGLEFDYVVLVDVNGSQYPADDESRHLLHIGATRAAHQLWLIATNEPSPLLPAHLRDG